MKDLYVYIFRSRNKDNAHLLNFHERCKTILAYIKCLAFSNTISYIQFRKSLKTMQYRI